MRVRTILVALALASTAGAAVIAQQKQAPPAPAQPKDFTLPVPREFTLENGLQVTLVPYGEVPKASVLLSVRSGNVDEAPDEIWLADVMGDLAQEGTTTRSASQIAEEAAGMGGSVGVSVGLDQTSVSGSALSEFVPGLVALVADIARNPAFPAEPLARIKADRQRTLSVQLSQPQARAQSRFHELLYPDHPYGRIFPTAEMIDSYTVEQLKAFHTRHFTAARAHLYVSGRYDAAAVEQAIRTAFGDWAAGEPARYTPPTPVSTRAIYLVDSPGAVQSTIYLGLPVIDPSNPDYVPLQVTNSLLGGSFGSRITRNIREQKGYTYSPVSTLSARYRDAYWAEIADVTTNVTGASLKEIFHEIDRLRTEPPSAEELRGIQNYMAGTFVLQNSSRTGIIAQLSFVNLHGLGRDWLSGYVQQVYAVTPETVTRVMQSYLDPARMTIVVVGDRSQIEAQIREYGEVRS